jgi:peptide/nickel transport system substrate-binding protein
MWLGFAEQRDPASPFHDVRVRQAVSYAIDWNAINKALLFGLGKPYNGVIEPGAFGHDPTLKNPYSYDPVKAKALLAEAGYPNGFETSFYTHVSYIRTMQAAQSYLAAVGIKGEIKQVEDATHWATLRQNALNPGTLKGIFHHGYGLFSDAYFAVEGVLASYGQYTTINVPEMDALYAKTKTAMDPKERARLFNQIQKMSLDQAYYVYGLLTPGIHLYGPRVESYRPLYGGTYEAAYTGYETVRLKR